MKREVTISVKEPKVSSQPIAIGSEETFHLHLTGIVQGVGFRPMVYNFARRLNLKGYVCNAADGVHIEFIAKEEDVKNIVESLLGQAPPLANVQHWYLSKINFIAYEDFTIKESDETTMANLPLTADFALCSDCRSEMHDANNRRFQYPFITCTQCGPRYSIIQQLPYDRINTTMSDFRMCVACEEEYRKQTNKRYFSQTNSCSDCGIQLGLYAGSQLILDKDQQEIIHTICEALTAGKIIAVKGIGGYLLLCDAANSDAIKTLRSRKQRPSKPFAIMCSSIAAANEFVYLNKAAKSLFLSPISPVVLAKAKTNTSLALNDIAPGLHSLGVMIPYAPLFELILSAFKKPVIATSGNISNSPVIFDDKQALEYLPAIADFIVTHNRKIVTPQDDSVVRFTSINEQPIIIRRSRGWAPSFFGYDKMNKCTMLATGALMKSSFTIAQHDNIYISQYLGSTDSYDAQLSYRQTLQHLLHVLNASPQVIITDKHPQYFSSELAKELSIQYGAGVIEVQHHKAHFAAVLAESNLLQVDEKVLGVIWDGTGLGDDGQIWGGEFFLFHENNMQRYQHIDYFPMLLGDKMAKEPRIAALALCSDITLAVDLLQSKFSSTEWALYQSMLNEKHMLNCGSVGRVFDAVASLLGICDKQSYEGEAALLLETKAQEYVNDNGYEFDCYYSAGEEEQSISAAFLLKQLLQDIKLNRPIEQVAACFHFSLVMLVKQVAENAGCKKITFSGGVFQNALLVDLMQYHLSDQYELFFHKELSSNDENISFGQLVYADQGIDGVGSLNKT